jgi:hypothetical protein
MIINMSYKGNINTKFGFINKPSGQPCYTEKKEKEIELNPWKVLTRNTK